MNRSRLKAELEVGEHYRIRYQRNGSVHRLFGKLRSLDITTPSGTAIEFTERRSGVRRLLMPEEILRYKLVPVTELLRVGDRN